MKISLSTRLLACCGFVRPGDRVADIGCDHGYLGIHLLKENIASYVIAADINEGPLQSAMRNAEKYGVRERMDFYLSDGVKNIPRDFNVMVCAGMGGDTMVHILKSATWLQSAQYELVLQCQSKTQLLRQYLSDAGWHIAQESIVRDGKFLYTVMKVQWNPHAPRLTPAECYISPALQNGVDPELIEYIDRIMNGLALAFTHSDEPEKIKIWEELKKIRSNYGNC